MFPSSRRTPAARPPALVALALAGLAGALLAAPGCATRIVREPIVSQGNGALEVYLRSRIKGGQPVDEGFEHPAVIAPVRIAHILGRIDVRVGKGKDAERRAAVPLQMIYTLGDAISQGLAAAGPAQEVVVSVRRRERRLAVLHQDYLTSFLVFVRDGALEIHFGYSEWEIPKFGEGPGRDDEPPEPEVGKPHQKMRVLPGPGMVAIGPQALVVDWRDTVFADSGGIHVSPTGRVQRRTILMEESPPEDEAGPSYQPLPESLSPETLRRLADLEEARRNGELTEAEYQLRRQAILREDPSAL